MFMMGCVTYCDISHRQLVKVIESPYACGIFACCLDTIISCSNWQKSRKQNNARQGEYSQNWYTNYENKNADLHQKSYIFVILQI